MEYLIHCHADVQATDDGKGGNNGRALVGGLPSKKFFSLS